MASNVDWVKVEEAAVDGVKRGRDVFTIAEYAARSSWGETKARNTLNRLVAAGKLERIVFVEHGFRKVGYRVKDSE